MGFLKLFMRRPALAVEFVIAAGIGILVASAVPKVINNYYDNIEKEHLNDVGKKATDETVWAYSIDDILSNDTFSILVNDKEEYKFDGCSYFDDDDPCEIYNVKLESGERVAVRIFTEDLLEVDENQYLLNIGKITKFDLTSTPELLEELQAKYPLNRTDFYVDLRSDVSQDRMYSKGTREKAIKSWQQSVGLTVGAIMWILLHVIAVQIGIEPKLCGKDTQT